MVDDTYFSLRTMPEGAEIFDFRDHVYADMARKTPQDVIDSGLEVGKVNARTFLRGLADVDSEILRCQSQRQLYERLEALAVRADMNADIGHEVNISCAVRDNVYQLLRHLRN